jgi:hypothetical protein
MPDLVVIDTGVLQKANAPLDKHPGAQTKFKRRLDLLSRLRLHQLTVLVSNKLLAEYQRQVSTPRNDFIRAFFELLASPGGAVPNWCRWSGNKRGAASECRFPPEDYHVLRTAICPAGSTILSEEHRMLVTDACIHRRLGVHVIDPTA